jgi:hypothetical protein
MKKKKKEKKKKGVWGVVGMEMLGRCWPDVGKVARQNDRSEQMNTVL